MRSLQESLHQRKDNIFCESSCCLIPPNICSAAPKKPFLKPPSTIDCSVIIELLTCCRSGIGQCTHGRGGAESVLKLSPMVNGVVLHQLGANLTRRKGKYTSASPRCTCLPSRQICIRVALGDPPQTPLQC